jgi:hypothetical protein
MTRQLAYVGVFIAGSDDHASYVDRSTNSATDFPPFDIGKLCGSLKAADPHCQSHQIVKRSIYLKQPKHPIQPSRWVKREFHGRDDISAKSPVRSNQVDFFEQR